MGKSTINGDFTTYVGLPEAIRYCSFAISAICPSPHILGAMKNFDVFLTELWVEGSDFNVLVETYLAQVSV